MNSLPNALFSKNQLERMVKKPGLMNKLNKKMKNYLKSRKQKPKNLLNLQANQEDLKKLMNAVRSLHMGGRKTRKLRH